ncbi:ATP synthase subunit C family protein [Rickettsia parkeri str. Tate's Hell]|uniref:ATP synthase subunit c n=2 Tax=Rickettsia parkeri TaxID=35792 RepID=A0ABR5DR67_RICPA|nr:ATP synthase subunit C family protein [Rickettsia parkeri str. AT\
MVSLKFIGTGLMAIGMYGAALSVSNIFSSLLSSIARNPSATENLQRMALIGAGLAEAMGLFSFVIAMLLIFS